MFVAGHHGRRTPNPGGHGRSSRAAHPPIQAANGSTHSGDPAIVFVVTDDARVPEGLEFLRAAPERTQAVARQLVGLPLHDANELATRSGRRPGVVKHDGNGVTVTADLDSKRINIETEGDIVVGSSSG